MTDPQLAVLGVMVISLVALIGILVITLMDTNR